MAIALTPTLLIAIVAAILAILFDWLPGLAPWYDKLLDGQKRGIMALLLLIGVAVIFALSCVNWLSAGITCDKAGIQVAVYLLIQAIVINQGVHILTKPA